MQGVYFDKLYCSMAEDYNITIAYFSHKTKYWFLHKQLKSLELFKKNIPDFKLVTNYDNAKVSLRVDRGGRAV